MTLLANMGNGMSGMPGPWMGPLMMLFWLLLVVLVIAGVVMLVRWLAAGGGGRASDRDEALATARKRLARGEIGPQEFETIKETLEER